MNSKTVSKKLATAALVGLLSVGAFSACESTGGKGHNNCKSANGCKGKNSCKDNNSCGGK